MADNEDLLQLLNAHGNTFMQSFGEIPSADTRKRKRDIEEAKSESSEEEWTGITNIQSDEEFSEDDDYDQDDGFIAGSSIHAPSVVVFNDTSSSKTSFDPISHSQKKAFMSSKVSKLKDDSAGSSKTKEEEEQEDEDRSNAQNDAILHRLVHTKLLSGSLNADLDLKPAQRKKALAGRVLELAGSARTGKGEKSVRQAERNKHAKRVRTGLVDKEHERQKAQLEEAKHMGNYHRSLKKVFEDPDASSKKKERERGLRMGVGKFSGGMLKLSREEISQVNGQPRGKRIDNRGGGRGRGRGRGRGKH